MALQASQAPTSLAEVLTTEQPEAGERAFTAYELPGYCPMPLVPAWSNREWMKRADRGWPYRCLPLVMANQLGWFILSSHAVFARWDGGPGRENLVVMAFAQRGAPPGPPPVSSWFGNGILTWHVPFLFRTPPGYNLLARGPTNFPKDGIAPMDGEIESDWSVTPFTMNWQLTRPGLTVAISVGEPICMVVPHRRHELESLAPVRLSIEAEPELAERYRRFTQERYEFKAHRAPGTWQKHYTRGLAPDGQPAPEHQTKVRLRPFARRTEPGPEPNESSGYEFAPKG